MDGLHVVVVQLQRGVAAEALEAHNVIGVVVDFGTDFAQRQIVRANVVHHKDVTLHLWVGRHTDACGYNGFSCVSVPMGWRIAHDLQFHVVLCGGALDAQQHRIRAQRNESDGDRVLLVVRLPARRERVLDHALVQAEFVGHRFCANQGSLAHQALTDTRAKHPLTIVARWPRIRCHVALARVRVPLLHAHAAIRARILTALRRTLAAVHHQRAGHDRVLGQLRRRIGQVQRGQATLEARP